MSEITVLTTGSVSGYSDLLVATPLKFSSIGNLVGQILARKPEDVDVAIVKTASGMSLQLISGMVDAASLLDSDYYVTATKPVNNTVRWKYEVSTPSSSTSVSDQDSSGDNIELSGAQYIDRIVAVGVLEGTPAGLTGLTEVGSALVVSQTQNFIVKFDSDAYANTSDFNDSEEIATFSAGAGGQFLE